MISLYLGWDHQKASKAQHLLVRLKALEMIKEEQYHLSTRRQKVWPLKHRSASNITNFILIVLSELLKWWGNNTNHNLYWGQGRTMETNKMKSSFKKCLINRMWFPWKTNKCLDKRASFKANSQSILINPLRILIINKKRKEIQLHKDKEMEILAGQRSFLSHYSLQVHQCNIVSLFQQEQELLLTVKQLSLNLAW